MLQLFSHCSDWCHCHATSNCVHAAQDQGKLVMAGAFGDPVSGGLFIFKDTSEEEIEQYAKSDPYQLNGLITGWKIMPYAVAIGN